METMANGLIRVTKATFDSVDFQSSTDSTGGFSHDPTDPSQMTQVETVVKQGLELQLCVLECLLLAGYDPQISRSDIERILGGCR